MSDLNSWEDDPAAQEENLSRQTQQMNINAQANTFRPGANSFQPGANTFQPGPQNFQPNQQYPQYGGYQGGYPQYTQGGGLGQMYPQYGQQFPPYGQQNPQYGQYNGWSGPGGNNQGYEQQYAGSQQPQLPPQQAPRMSSQQVPTIAKRPAQQAASDLNKPIKYDGAPKTLSIGGASSAPKAKVLSVGGETAAPKAKVLSIGEESAAPKAKVLSIGATVPKKEDEKPAEAKKEAVPAVAAKAIEASNTGTSSPTPSSGRSSPSRAVAAKGAREVDAVLQEQTADVDEETLKEIYGKEHVNIIFIGHVDAGKSTLGGSILISTGMIDERTVEKNKAEAKALGRETWYISWALDLTKEERTKGKTVEVGRAYFETDTRRYSILDAPGHKTYVPSMIGGASQADVGILVISARKGEYETGFEKGGQTREHAMLAKTQGVNQLVVVINKMDDPTVEWSKERYDECTTKLGSFLRTTGYNLKTDVFFLPVAAQSFLNIKERLPAGVCPWWNGPSLLEYLDNMKSLERKLNAPFMMPINGKYRDMGTVVEGKVEAGMIQKGTQLIMMPNKDKVEVTAIYGESEEEVPAAKSGDQVKLRLRGVEEEDVLPGFVVCSPKRVVHVVRKFEAQIRIIDLKSILSAGFNCVMHVHSAIEEVTFDALLHKLQPKTGRKSKLAPSHAKKGDSIIARLEVIGGTGVCCERFEDYAQLGRFTLREQGNTIAIGKITQLITEQRPV